jgi:muconolactone delta-isomerase
LEERKRKYKKALKKEKRRGGKKGTLWRTHSGYSTASMGESSDEDDDDEGEKAEEADVPNVSYPSLSKSTSRPHNAC